MAKLNHKIKLKSRVVQKVVSLTEMEEDLEAKGYEVNKESLRSRSRVRKTIKDIEEGQDRVAKMALDDESDDGDELMQDDKLAAKEGQERGRAKKRLRD